MGRGAAKLTKPRARRTKTDRPTDEDVDALHVDEFDTVLEIAITDETMSVQGMSVEGKAIMVALNQS